MSSSKRFSNVTSCTIFSNVSQDIQTELDIIDVSINILENKTDNSFNNLDISGNLKLKDSSDATFKTLTISGDALYIADGNTTTHVGGEYTTVNDVDLTGWQDASLNNVDVSGNLDVSGAVTIVGHTDLQDVSLNNVDVSGAVTIAGQLTVEGGLILHGTKTEILTTNTDICDNIITLNVGVNGNSDKAKTSGIIIERGQDASNVFMGWYDNSKFIFGETDLSGASEIIPPESITPADLLVKNIYTSNVDVSGNLDVSGAVTIVGHTDLQDVSLNNVDVSGDLDVAGAVTIVGHTDLQDVSMNKVDVSGGVIIAGHTDLQDVSMNNMYVNNNVDVSGDLDVAGAVTIVGHTDLQYVSMNNMYVNNNVDLPGKNLSVSSSIVSVPK